MCSRYYIDSGITDELERTFPGMSGQFRMDEFCRDIRPTDKALVIEWDADGWHLDTCRWGYPLQRGRNLMINARTESVMEKPAFQNGIRYHRLLIPASGFYEWNALKERSTFTRRDAQALYMAGFCDWFDGERRFVILTTAANDSMIRVHDRMPLILEREQVQDWFDDMKEEAILRQTPVMLRRETEYEQLSLFDQMQAT